MTFILLMIGNVNNGFSQSKDGKAKSVIMMDFKLPSPIRNKAFQGVMNGLANVDVVFQYQLENNIGIGAGAKYAYFDVNGNVFQTNIVGKMEGYSPYLKIAKRSLVGENNYVEYSLMTGYNLFSTRSNQSSSLYRQQGINVEPKVGFYMKSSDNLSFGIIVSYNFINFEFTPDNLNLNYFPGVSQEYSHGKSQVFAVGFGFSANLVRNKN